MAEAATPSTQSDAESAERVGPTEVLGGRQRAGLLEAKLIKRAFTELLGTFVFILLGLGGYLWATVQAGDRLPVSLGFGFALIAVLMVFGPISGGYFNPATTLAGAIAGRLRWLTAAIYAVAQVLGALLAGLVLFVVVNAVPLLTGQVSQVFTQLGNGFDERSPLKLPLLSVGLIELIGTAVLAAVVLAAFRPGSERSGLSRTGGAVAVGLTYVGLVSSLAPLTNAGINPARSMAVLPWSDPALWGQLWLFWLAPLAGAALAGLIYRGFIAPEGDAGSSSSAILAPTGTEPEETVEGATAEVKDDRRVPDTSADAVGAAEAHVVDEETSVDKETKDFFDKKS